MSLEVMVVKKEEGVFVVSPTGSVDSDTYLVLEQEVETLLENRPKVVIFDMRGVHYISSSGLGVVFKTKKVLQQNQGKVYLVNLTPPVKKVFDVVNALPEQEVFASVEELDNYLDKIQSEEN